MGRTDIPGGRGERGWDNITHTSPWLFSYVEAPRGASGGTDVPGTQSKPRGSQGAQRTSRRGTHAAQGLKGHSGDWGFHSRGKEEPWRL